MQDRRAGGAEGLLACPFLALAGDRDIRIDVPDRRHRCYAEPEPAPRAIAHQQEYCLTPSFSACPTFQDWARREAAHVVGGGGSRDSAPVPGPASAVDEEPVVWRAADGAPDREVAQEPTLWGDGRTWAAPPPWLGTTADEGSNGPRERPAGDRPAMDASAADDRHPAPPARDRPSSLPGPIPDDPRSGAARHDDVPGGGDLPAFLSRRGPARADQEPPAGARLRGVPDDDGRGRTGDAATDWSAPGDSRPAFRTPVTGGAARPSPDLRPDGTPRPGRAPRSDGPAFPGRGEAARDGAVVGPEIGGEGRVSAARGARRGPDWERPLRRESYPTLHMPAGLPHVPRLWLGLVALVVAALLLFLLPTLLPGFFGAQPAATPAPTASSAPSISIAPTPPPQPTPFVYTVVQGDTLSGIATKYGLTVSELLKANPQIKNENKLGIGDRVTIPVKGASSGGSATGPSPAGTAAP